MSLSRLSSTGVVCLLEVSCLDSAVESERYPASEGEDCLGYFDLSTTVTICQAEGTAAAGNHSSGSGNNINNSQGWWRSGTSWFGWIEKC